MNEFGRQQGQSKNTAHVGLIDLFSSSYLGDGRVGSILQQLLPTKRPRDRLHQGIIDAAPSRLWTDRASIRRYDQQVDVKDGTWLTPTGDEMTAQHWSDPAAKCFGLLLDGRAQTTGIRKRGSEATLLLITNAHHDVVTFTLPTVAGGRDWIRLVDTNLPEEDQDIEDATPLALGHRYQVTGRSLLLFLLRQKRPSVKASSV